MRTSNWETVRFSGLPWSLISAAPAVGVLWLMISILTMSGSNGDAALESKLNIAAYVGWGVAIPLLGRAWARPAFIDVGRETVSFRGYFFWAQPRTLEYRDVLRFEYRRYRLGERQNNELWLVVAIMRSGTTRTRATLPYFGRKPFGRLKSALAEWQIAHGCLEPIPFANFSEDVRF
jgi:hypothetical protein